MHSIKGKQTCVWLVLIGLIASIAKVNSSFQCLQCSTDSNNDCLKSTYEKKNCDTEGVKQCYTRNVNGVITRGCYDDKAKPCEEGPNCIVCKSEGCNNQNICKTCDTNDKDCSQTNVSDDKFNRICKASDTKCYVNVKDKKVERRCSNDDDKCEGNTCKECSDANCNAGIFPESRIQCFQCDGANCDTAGSNSAKPCLNYNADDKCYATGASAETMIRGCLSDATPNPCEGADKHCVICDKDKCNDALYKRDAKLTCVKCNDTACADAQKEDTATVCEKPLLYNQTETCFTETKGSIVQRGCLYDETNDACLTEDTCKKCDTNGCNNAKVDVKFTCIVCRSDEDKKCWNDAGTLSGKTCRTNESSPQEGCFHGIWNGIAIRGCYVDASPPMKVICSDKENKQCNLCFTANCNKEKSSGAGSLKLSVGILAVVLTLFWNFM